MYFPEGVQDVENSPFYLKRKGDFPEALKSYAHHYADAKATGNLFVCEQTFEQIFDIFLLKYLKEEKRFRIVACLRNHLESDIGDLLREEESFEDKYFQQYFASCWRRFSPRGRANNSFNVDRRLLLER